MARVKKEIITRLKNKIKGKFILSDKSVTKFEICKKSGWQQWGNINENLSLTVDRIEQLEKELWK